MGTMTDSAARADSEAAAGAREALYRFLAGVFGRPPSPALVQRARDGSLLAELEPLGGGEGLDLLRRFAAREGTPSELADQLGIEYTGLFVLPGAGKAQPFESIYLDPEQRVGGPVSMAVERAYEHAGAEPSLDRIHLSDHLAVELEFLAFLCGREREAREVGAAGIARRCLALEHEFLTGHLSQWVGRFVADVRERASTEFYPAMAWVTDQFVRLDLQEVRAILGELERASE
jgi:anaerobic sulfite reductase subunit A